MSTDNYTDAGTKTVEGRTINNGKPVKVSMKKLTAGINTIFSGVIEILGAMESSAARELASGYISDREVAGAAIEALDTLNQVRGAGKMKEGAAGNETQDAADGSSGSDVCGGNISADDIDDEVGTASKLIDSKADKKAAALSLTADDITKIIVQKLKKDRSNNEKIGAILKTYGVAKVSELAEAQYEAFLTDLSAL